MGDVVDDIVNPIGAITGVDPVKDATGFTGTSFGPTKAQQQAAAAGGTTQATSSGGGGSKTIGNAMSGLVAQNYAKQQQAIQQPTQQTSQPQQPAQQVQQPMGSSFGNQLAALSQQITAPPVVLPAVASPSANQVASGVTSQAVGKQNPQQGAQGMWGFPSIYAPR